MYYLHNKFLFRSNTITTLELIVNSALSTRTVTINSDERKLTIEVPTGTNYSTLSNVSGFTIRPVSNSLIVNGLYLLNYASTIVNGVAYFVSSNLLNLTSLLVDGSVLARGVYVSDSEVSIILNQSDLVLTINNYVTFVNSSPNLYCEVVNSGNWSVSNFYSINLNRISAPIQFSSLSVYTRKEYAITDVDIINAFITWIKSENPKWSVGPELSDLLNLDQKSEGYFIFQTGLSTPSTDLAGHLQGRVDMGNFLRTTIPVKVEYLVDDITKYSLVRNSLLLQLPPFLTRVFPLIDYNDLEWNCLVIWKYDFEALNQSPTIKNFSETNLYALDISCELVGWTVEKLTEQSKIENIILHILNTSLYYNFNEYPYNSYYDIYGGYNYPPIGSILLDTVLISTE